MFFFAVAQVLLAFAPLGEARFGADAQSHVESAGTNSHHAHDGADCTACAARCLVATPGHGEREEIAAGRSTLLAFSARSETQRFIGEAGSRPRAPPIRQA